MDIEWMDKYFLDKLGVVKDYKEEWEATRYLLDSKMLGMLGAVPGGREVLTVKCDPEYGAHLRLEHEDIIAGYHMNKVHWNSIYLDGCVPVEVVKDMIDNSYELIFAGLTKKRQKEMLGDR